MGANAQTTVPTFTSGQVLTADQQNQSARTGVPVFATTVERDAAFGGSGEKTLAEGQLAYLEDSNIVQYYDGSVWATVGPSPSGATLVKAQAVSGSATNVDNAFSATYLNYLLVAEFAGSTTATITMRLRASGADNSTSNYFLGAEGRTNDGSDTTWANDGATSWTIGYTSTAVAARRNRQSFTVYAPQAAERTGISGTGTSARTTNIGIGGFFAGGEFALTTAFDGFSIIASAGTISGTVRVYGLADS